MKGSAHKLPVQLPRRNRSTLTNEVQAKLKEGVRTWQSVIIDGVHFKERRTITPPFYSRLDVDPRYQRGRTDMVATIINALQKGGMVPDVPMVAERAWGEPDGKVWIMDGFQRVSAFMELNRAFEVDVFLTSSLEAERRFFLALNNRRPLNSNTQIKAWAGPVVDLLRYLGEREGVLKGRVEFEHASGRGKRLSAALLVRGIERLLSESRHVCDIQKSLSRCDGFLQTDRSKLEATTFCLLVGESFPEGGAGLLPVLALAEIAREKWHGHSATPKLPSPAIIKRLAETRWRVRLPGQGRAHLDLAVSIVRRVWK